MLIAKAAEACPACLTSDRTGGSVTQRLLVAAVMGMFPIIVAGTIGFKIYRICQHHPQKLKNKAG